MASAKNFANIQQWQTTKCLEYANIDGVKNPPDGFTEWAEAKGAVNLLLMFWNDSLLI